MGAKFQHLIDKFSQQIKGAEITPSTEVILIFRWMDASGTEVSSARESLDPLVKVDGMGRGDAAQRFAQSLYVGTILDNLKRCILDAPDGLVRLRGWPTPVQILDIDLEIH